VVEQMTYNHEIEGSNLTFGTGLGGGGEIAKNCKKLQKIAKNCKKLQKIAKYCKILQKFAKNGKILQNIAKY
jgi:hypothetical protein